jgi:hypothetical protein
VIYHWVFYLKHFYSFDVGTHFDKLPSKFCFYYSPWLLVCCVLIFSYFKDFSVFFLFYCLFIYSYVHTLFRPSFHCPLYPSLLSRTCSALFSKFFSREVISNNRKDIAFLITWYKFSYTERFLTLLPCMCVLQPKLVHLYLTPSLLPSHLLIVTSVSLRLLY